MIKIIDYIIWIRRKLNLADAMTKTGINAEFVRIFKDGKPTYEVENSIINKNKRLNRRKEKGQV